VDHRIPRIGTAISVVLAIGALITFVFLNQKFEGPNPLGFIGDPYQIDVRFESTKTLPTKQPVLHRGVSVGRVNKVKYDAETDESIVTFTLNDEFAPLHEDAKIQIGERSLLGDAYLNVLEKGTDAEPALERGDELSKVCPTAREALAEDPDCNIVPPVNFDEALDFLDEDGRARVRSLIDTVAEGASREGNDLRLNDTTGGVVSTITELRALTDSLEGQEDEISRLVSDSATVLTELGNREAAVRTIVGAGRVTLDALAANTASLQQGIEELPPLLSRGREALELTRPLLRELRPVLVKLRGLAPDITAGFAGGEVSLGPITTDVVSLVKKLEPQRRALEQIAPSTVKFLRILKARIKDSTPSALNSVPIADYLAPRADSIGAFFALTRSATAPTDADGRYGRFGVVFDPALFADQTEPVPRPAYQPQDGTCVEAPAFPNNFCYNAFPGPLDSLSNQPFGGGYPRLFPYDPPSRQSVLP
jgi:phospholipid/cholesterol/gamma-HCH transport system substrate-binding protein